MDEQQVNARKQLEAQLIARALQDEAFRQELLRDPKGIFARELGITMPEHIQVQVLEESPTTVYLVLPQLVTGAGNELSDVELEDVAGGATERSVCVRCRHTIDNPSCIVCPPPS